MTTLEELAARPEGLSCGSSVESVGKSSGYAVDSGTSHWQWLHGGFSYGGDWGPHKGAATQRLRRTRPWRQGAAIGTGLGTASLLPKSLRGEHSASSQFTRTHISRMPVKAVL